MIAAECKVGMRICECQESTQAESCEIKADAYLNPSYCNMNITAPLDLG